MTKTILLFNYWILIISVGLFLLSLYWFVEIFYMPLSYLNQLRIKHEEISTDNFQIFQEINLGFSRNLKKANKTLNFHNQLYTVTDIENRIFTYSKESRFIWIGGIPRSGTTLMRVLLDTHPQVRCGPETHILIDLLTELNKLLANKTTKLRLAGAGIKESILNNVFSSAILELIISYAPPAEILCTKDPILMSFSILLNKLFPNSKFILMVRDGRAVVHSLISSMLN